MPVIGPDGAVRSWQDARLRAKPEILADLWAPEGLESLARSYWIYLRRSTGGLVRVIYGSDSRRIVLLSPRLTLLRFCTPLYEPGQRRARVTWPIRDGVLVARAGHGRGHLRLTLTDEKADSVLIRSEISDYHPRLGGRGLVPRVGAWAYSQTQLRVHTWITRGFLRSLAASVGT